jgi:hypothetical protein
MSKLETLCLVLTVVVSGLGYAASTFDSATYQWYLSGLGFCLILASLFGGLGVIVAAGGLDAKSNHIPKMGMLGTFLVACLLSSSVLGYLSFSMGKEMFMYFAGGLGSLIIFSIFFGGLETVACLSSLDSDVKNLSFKEEEKAPDDDKSQIAQE